MAPAAGDFLRSLHAACMAFEVRGFSSQFAPMLSGHLPNSGAHRTHAVAFAESRQRARQKGKLLINIRISTGGEINGTVKWDV
jgi:hypothetical protein